jgi:hypothetical protein
MSDAGSMVTRDPHDARPSGRAANRAVLVLAVSSASLGLLGAITLPYLVSQSLDRHLDGIPSDLPAALASRLLTPVILAIVTVIGGVSVLVGRLPRVWSAVFVVVAMVGFAAAGGFYIVGSVIALLAAILALFAVGRST